MNIQLSNNVKGFIEKAIPKLLVEGGKIYLEKPFSGFFISFESTQDFIEKYSLNDFGFKNEPRDIYLYCGDLFGKKA